MQDSTADTWLIKSGGRILGPYSLDKIAELLRTREIALLDEASAPNRRWQNVQYHEDFHDVVDQLRKATLSDKTEGGWTPTNTSNLTQTLTDVADSGDLTQEITSGGVTSSFTVTSKEIVIHNVNEQQTRAPAQNLAAGRYQTAAGHSTAISHQVEKTTRGLWIVTALILTAVAAFIVQKRVNDPAPVKQTAASLKQDVVSDVQVGRYGDALRKLKNYYPDALQSGELGIYYGSLLIQLDGQTLMGRRLLNAVITGQRPETKQAYTGLGVADLIDNQLDSAAENFNKALKIDAAYNPAMINLAIVSLQKGDYEGAKALALKSLRGGLVTAEAVLVLAEAELYLYKNSRNPNALSQATKQIKDYREGQWDYAPEMDFYALYFEFLRGDRGLEDHIMAYLDQDPALTTDHRHSLFIFKGRFQWKILARLCEQMGEKLGESPRTSMFMASCYSQEGRWDRARTAIEKAVDQNPKDPLVQAWYSHVLKESGAADQASVTLGRAEEFNRRGEYVLPAVLQARFCQQLGDVDCAQKSWQKIYGRNTDHLPALAGLAWSYAEKKSHADTLQYLNKGLKVSPDYVPLLLIRQRAEKEGWYAAN